MELENKNITKSLKDYKSLFEKYLNGEDFKRIADKVRISERTVYNYIKKEMVPDSKSGEIISSEILEEALIILNEKKIELESI